MAEQEEQGVGSSTEQAADQTAGSSTEQATTASFDWEAWEKAEGEPTLPDKATIPDETSPEHPTQLGRKVKDLSAQVEALAAELAERNQADQGRQLQDNSQNISNDLFDELNRILPCPVDPDLPLTAREQVAYNNWYARAEAGREYQFRGAYAKKYLAQAGKLSSEGGDLHARILYLIAEDEKSPFNKVVHGMPEADAEINYRRAHAYLLSDKGKQSHPDTSTFNSQSAIGSGVTKPVIKSDTTFKEVNLSPEAKEYADYLGMSQEDRAEALGRPLMRSGVVRGS